VNEALYKAIEDRYGFPVPDDYRRLDSRGLLTLSASAHASAFTTLGSYLWLPDMEWYSLGDIAQFEFESYHKPGFVPFAFTAGGDHWCWQLDHTDERGTRVVCCHHDYELATVYAPNFAGALYRQTLAISDETELDVPAFLCRWAADLADIFSPQWCEHLRELAQRPNRSALASAYERADLAYEDLDTEIRWMEPVV
jgi:hypothetical protein